MTNFREGIQGKGILEFWNFEWSEIFKGRVFCCIGICEECEGKIGPGEK